MSWVMLDDKFHSHAKTAEVGNVGAGLFARSLSYCGDHLTDGFVPRGWAHEIGKRPLCLKLVDAGFWIVVEAGAGPFAYVAGEDSYTVVIEKPGYFIPDYLISNPNRATVLAKRSGLSDSRSEAGKKGAAARWQRDGKPDGKPLATRWQPDGPLAPTPTPGLKALGLAPVSVTHSPTSYEGTDSTPLDKLKDACHVDHDGVLKLNRAAKGCSEAALVAALEACTGPGVKSRLAVALSELKKRRAA